jgi:hypothetical protein
MNIDELTIGQAKELAARFAHLDAPKPCNNHERQPVIVCTDMRGVVFGYTTDIVARPILLTEARMALYWSVDVGGVFGLAEIGPTKGCKISATVSSILLEGVTAIFTVDVVAVKAWTAAPVQGR